MRGHLVAVAALVGAGIVGGVGAAELDCDGLFGHLVEDGLDPGELTSVAADVSCSGEIRPGARMVGGCTMNWVYRDAADALYIGVAGHCVSGVGQSIRMEGIEDPIGTVSFKRCCGQGNDFALVKVDPALYGLVNPTLCRWGGPVGGGDVPEGEKVLVHGFGFIYGDTPATRARVGVSEGAEATLFQYFGMAQPGDSGMPVMGENGAAVAIHTHSTPLPGGIHTSPAIRPDPNHKFGTLVSAGLAWAEAELGTTFEVVPGGPLTMPLP